MVIVRGSVSTGTALETSSEVGWHIDTLLLMQTGHCIDFMGNREADNIG